MARCILQSKRPTLKINFISDLHLSGMVTCAPNNNNSVLLGQPEDPQIVSVTEKVSTLSTTKRITDIGISTIIDTQSLTISETSRSDDDDVPLIQLLKKTSTKPQVVSLKRKEKHTVKIETPPSEPNGANKIKPKKGRATIKKIKSEEQAIKQNSDSELNNYVTEEDEENQWWLSENLENSSCNWETLEHNGVYFPPIYVPHNVKMKYKGIPVSLPPDAEEIVTFFAGVIGSPYESNPTFVNNFFNEFKKSLENTSLEHSILCFEDCDFSPIFEHLQQLKEQKKNRTKEEKLEEKKVNDVLIEKYGYCLLDGKKEKIGNFRVEPPGLFRGRGQHPKMGCLKVSFLSLIPRNGFTQKM